MDAALDAVIGTANAIPEDISREDLLAVIVKLQAIIDERWSETGILAQLERADPFAPALRTPFGSLLAAYCGGILAASGAPHYVAIAVDHPEDGPMMFCVHRRDGHSPLEQLAALRVENVALTERLNRIEGERDTLRTLIREAIDTTRLNRTTNDIASESNS